MPFVISTPMHTLRPDRFLAMIILAASALSWGCQEHENTLVVDNYIPVEITPEHFEDGPLTLIVDTKPGDQIALGAVHATQAPEIDGIMYSLEVEGTEAAQSPRSAPLSTPAPKDPMARALKHAHLRRLSKNAELMRTSQSRSPERQGGKFGTCLAPYYVGKTCTFWVLDPHDQLTQQTTTLKQISENAIWFEDNSDGSSASALTDSDFAFLADHFENVAYPSDRYYFGTPEDLDHNGKIFIVLSGKLIVPGEGGYMGYVSPADLLQDDESGVRSNEGEIIFLAHPSTYTQIGYTREEFFKKSAPTALVHELKHLIATTVRWYRGFPSEELWLEESTAVVAQELARNFADNAAEPALYGVEAGDIQDFAEEALLNPQNFRVVYDSYDNPDETYAMYGYNFLFLWSVAYAATHEVAWRTLVYSIETGMDNLQNLYGGRSFKDWMFIWGRSFFYSFSPDWRSSDVYQGLDPHNLEGNPPWANLKIRDLSPGLHHGSTRSLENWQGVADASGKIKITIDADPEEKPYFWLDRDLRSTAP